MKRLYQIPTPKPPIQGPTIQPWYLYPQQTRPTLLAPRQQPPSTWTPIGGVAASPTNQNYIFPVDQPARRTSYQIRTRVSAKAGQTPSISAKMPFTYPVSEPDRATFWREGERYRQDVVLYTLHTTITPPQTPYDFIQPTQRNNLAWLVAQPVATTLPILGAAAAAPQTTTIAIDAMPPAGYYQRPAPRLIVRVVKGTSQNLLIPQGLLDQPTRSWWHGIDRAARIPVSAIISGASTQATFVFPKDQPSGHWYLQRLGQLVAPQSGLDSRPPQQTYIYLLDQPIQSAYPGRVQLPITIRVVDGTTAARIQSDTFQGHVRPPQYRVVLDINRTPRLGPEPQFTGAAPLSPQLYTFSTLQPDPRYRTLGWRPELWPALQMWMSTFGPPPATIRTTLLTWNAEGTVAVTWNLNDGSTVTWNVEPTTLKSWPEQS